MRKSTAITAASASVLVGMLAVGVAGPATAAAPAKKRVAVVVPDKTIKQVLAGKTRLTIGDKGAAVREVQQRLNNVGIITPITSNYTNATSNAVDRFQGKFFWSTSGTVNKTTFLKLRSLTRNGSGVPKVCRTTKSIICVDKTQKVVRYYKKGNLVLSLDARFGGAGNRTREGNFRIHSKTPHNISTLYGTQMDWSLYFSGGQAIHFSQYFRADGYSGASHGCVNLRDWKSAKWLFGQAKVGSAVKVYH